MKFINFTIVKFSVFLTLGILTAHFTPASVDALIPTIIGLLMLLIFAWYVSRNRLLPNIFFGLIAFATIFFIGYTNVKLRQPKNQQVHFAHGTAENSFELFQLKVTEVLKPDIFNSKYIATIQAVSGKVSLGDVLLYIGRDSVSPQYEPDEILLINAAYTTLKPSLNPFQFEYATYMNSRGVFHQIHTTHHQVIRKLGGRRTLKGLAEQFRNLCIRKLSNTPLGLQERSILQALVLGQRKDIDKAVYTEYSQAGAVHILAVSGLHVGILFLIFNGLFRPLELLPHGRLGKMALMVCILWFFAFIAGFSPSVVRAVAMFSLFAVAHISSRPTNSFNTLFLSYFILLLFNPSWLFQVGFQFSYLAVFFILWLYPIFQKIYSPNNYVLQKLWGLISVSVSAQLGVTPLSIYYFHQFPGLFILTNLVILPFLGVILAAGLLIVILALLDQLPDALAKIYNFLIESMNSFIHWVAQQDVFLFSDISFSIPKVVAAYFLVISTILLLQKWSYARIIISLLSLTLSLTVFMFEKIGKANQQLVVFHKSKNTLLAYRNDSKMILYKADTIVNSKNKSPIKEFRVAQNISNYTEAILPSYLKYGTHTILIIDSLGIYPPETTVDIIILTGSPRINLDRLIDSLQPKTIIADGSNYTSYVNRWRKSCKKRKLLFHPTASKGAFILE